MLKKQGIVICQAITVSDNYLRLINKPKINGFELVGDQKAEQLNLLSNQIDEYEETNLATAGNNSYMLVFPQKGKPEKVRVGDVKSGTFTTADEITEETIETMEVGEFIFKKMEG